MSYDTIWVSLGRICFQAQWLLAFCSLRVVEPTPLLQVSLLCMASSFFKANKEEKVSSEDGHNTVIKCEHVFVILPLLYSVGYKHATGSTHS